MKTQLTKRKTIAKEPSTDGVDETSRLGIDWINLMMLTEHVQPEQRGERTSAPPRRIFRIELDTVMSDGEADEMQRLLGAPDFDGAREHLLAIKAKRYPKKKIPASVRVVITGAFIDPGARSSSVDASATPGQPILQVIEDFGGGRREEMARVAVDVELPRGTVGPLRLAAKSNREGAKTTVKENKNLTQRAHRILDAALD